MHLVKNISWKVGVYEKMASSNNDGLGVINKQLCEYHTGAY